MKKQKIAGTDFRIDKDGFVASRDFADLGALEDCEAFAALVWDLFETLHPDFFTQQ